MTNVAIERLYARPKWGQGLSLHRNAWLHAQLPCTDWIADQSAIKITGSNGKGSVAIFTAAILKACGVRTGCFTSPHLFDITERVQVDGNAVSSPALSGALDTVLSLVDTYEATYPDDVFGTFEILTAAALIAFEKQNSDALVIEAGVGGRLDVTRLIPGTLTAITSIDLEHQAILGPTREHILLDKADLCPPGGTLISGALSMDLEERLSTYLTLMDRTPVFTSHATQHRIRTTDSKGFSVDFDIEGLAITDVQLSALGQHQVMNAAQAMLLAKRWLSAEKNNISETAFSDACRQALAKTVPPLRLQKIQEDPCILADVCHSPDAALKAAEAVQQHFPGRPLVLLTGTSENKDSKGIVEALAAHATEIICSRANMMGRSAEDIAQHLPQKSVTVIDDLEEAATHAKARALESDAVLLIAGGLFLAAEAVTLLRGQKRETLKFL